MKKFTQKDYKQARKQGWNLYNAEGEFQIQYEGELGIFESDADAWLFVKKQAADGDELANKVLNFLKTESVEEYNRIMDWKGEGVSE